ncbi:MAG: hypothetical protein MUO31_08790 [Thermodesulfovibrionales bacterium]|nr:hypothetical protein [Thermodesulfovibrionales bacterium]
MLSLDNFYMGFADTSIMAASLDPPDGGVNDNTKFVVYVANDIAINKNLYFTMDSPDIVNLYLKFPRNQLDKVTVVSVSSTDPNVRANTGSLSFAVSSASDDSCGAMPSAVPAGFVVVPTLNKGGQQQALANPDEAQEQQGGVEAINAEQNVVNQ